jgi:hypothetical protein
MTTGQPPQKTLLPLLLHVDSLLHSGDHSKYHSSIVAHILLHRNVFVESLPSNELFWLSGIMSQYITGILNIMFAVQHTANEGEKIHE